MTIAQSRVRQQQLNAQIEIKRREERHIKFEEQKRILNQKLIAYMPEPKSIASFLTGERRRRRFLSSSWNQVIGTTKPCVFMIGSTQESTVTPTTQKFFVS